MLGCASLASLGFYRTDDAWSTHIERKRASADWSNFGPPTWRTASRPELGKQWGIQGFGFGTFGHLFRVLCYGLGILTLDRYS